MSKTIITFVDDKEKTDREVKLESKSFDHVRVFDEYSPMWKRNCEYNKVFIEQIEQQATDILMTRGYIFLNEVYNMLGLTPTKIGQLVGWTSNNNRSVVDLGLKNQTNRRFMNGEINSIIIEPNVDGEILSKL